MTYSAGPKHTAKGVLHSTQKRIHLIYHDAIRSLFTVLVSIGLAWCGIELTQHHPRSVTYLIYITVTYLVLNSTWNVLDCWTSYFESVQTSISEQHTWTLVDKRLYEHAILLHTTNEPNQMPRQVCLIQSHSTAPATPAAPAATPAVKPVLLFVHGSMARLGQYNALMKLAEAQDYTYVAYDQYGMGRSPKPEGPANAYHTEQLVQDLLGVYQYTCDTYPNRPIVVVGHSYGCCLTLKLLFLLQDPCVDTAALPLPQATVLLGAYRWNAASKRSGTLRKVLGMPPQWLLRLGRKQLSSGFRARAFAAASLVDPKLNKVLQYADAVSGNNAFHVVQPFYRSSANQTITVPELLRFDAVEGDKKTGQDGRRGGRGGGGVRVYFVTGQEDVLAPPDGARILSNALPQTSVGDVTVVRNAGHQVMEEQPDAVFGIIQQAMDEL